MAYLKSSEPELWKWASSTQSQSDYAQELRTHLLKTTYRLDAQGHPELAQKATAIVEKLGLNVSVTLYQANGGIGMNAAICHLPGEAHVIFTGPILAALQGAELDAVLGHELAHFQLWNIEDGEFLTADRLLGAACNDARGASSHVQTARRFRLYTEIFADRGSLAASGDLNATVAALVRIETGLSDVSAASYLRQADEIFERENTETQGIEHPETFIRARALRMWSEEDPALNDWLASVIEGPLKLDELDLPGQQKMSKLTERFLAELLRPKWIQTEPVLAHARAYFPAFKPSARVDETVATELKMEDAAGREFLSYVLLDFVAVDPQLEDTRLAAALEWSERLGISETFEKLAVKELGIGKRQLNKVKKEAVVLLAKAEGQQ